MGAGPQSAPTPTLSSGPFRQNDLDQNQKTAKPIRNTIGTHGKLRLSRRPS